ncbi:glutamine-hydrolyzing GMP synthase [Patescibacteria group bacterium]|nr:glutamine-hydrolyzing GMP synthase [Patescibacteria group bacterium]
MKNKTHEKIVILDCGSQFTHLISKKVRDLGVYSEIVMPDTRASSLVGTCKGIIISGGPSSVFSDDSPKVDPNIFDLDIPILGICYGHQLIAHMLGGEVAKGEKGEYGKSTLECDTNCSLFEDVPQKSVVWMSHFDEVKEVPEGFSVAAAAEGSDIAAMANEERKIFSMQFHPEVTHTEYGETILSHFLFDVCSVKKTWSLEQYLEEIEDETRKKVGDRSVFVLLSGGVDSLVVFTLLNKILSKDRVFGLHVDTGFMRKDESKEIADAMDTLGYKNIKIVDASQEFFDNVKGVFDPEEKRKIIGRTFIDVFNREVEKLYLDSHEWMLGQGTIYPDTIESGRTKHADTIKTHHNRVAEIEKLILEGRVVEPLEKLYKDDVRKVGEVLGLPEKLVWRRPFPGPGLAIMALCTDHAYDDSSFTLSKEDNEVIDECISDTDLSYFPLPLKSVGVQGDERTYAHPLVLQGDSDYETLERVATEVPNALKSINRVVWLLHPKKIEAFDIKEATLTKERIAVLQEAHAVANKHLEEAGLSKKIKEMPVVMIPLSLNGGESIVLRPLTTENFMTIRFFRIPGGLLKEMTDDLLNVPGVDAVFYDVTNKPPGTVQWE